MNSDFNAPAATTATELTELRAALVQARTAAAATQRHFTELVNLLGEGALLTDADGLILLINEPLLALWGLPGPVAGWVGQLYAALLDALQPYAADPAGFRARIQELHAGRQPVFTDLIPLRDGRVLERDFVPVPARPDEAPGAGRTLVRLRDASARHQATAALRDLASIPTRNPNPVFRLSPVGKLLYANAAAHALYAPLPAAEQARVRTEAQTLAAEALTDGLTRRLSLAVAEQHFAATVLPFAAEGYVNVYLADITPQKQTQQALARREKQLTDLLRFAPALICTHDPQGYLLTVNPAVADFMGLPEARMLGQHLHTGIPTEHHAAVDAYLVAIGQQGQHQGVLPMCTASGERRYVLYHSYRVSEAGQAPYIIGYGQDITGRIEAERAMKRAKEAAEAAVTARESFLANMSHEIRTPLNGVLGMAAQLDKTPLDARQQEFVTIIRSSGQHLLSVINDVLDMAKITSGKLELEQIPFNICDSMGQALAPLMVQAQEKGLRFFSRPLRETCPHPWVLGDPYRLNQILLNLVSNAIKFTPAGGELRVMSELTSETDTTLRVRFSVQDSGIGIAANKQAAVFEGFTQAYASTTRRFGGTGLGLSISRALVGQLGGTLTLQSAPGEGSTFAFEIELPRAAPAKRPAADATADTAPAAYDTGALRGRRMLLFEDNEINRTLARLLLEEWGVTLDEAAAVPAGLALYARHRYDAVLMDIQMPGMSGLDATAHIRALPNARRAQVPILALTANAFRADNERYLAAGLDACLTKPYDETQLYQTLVRLLAAANLAPAAANPAAAADDDDDDAPAYELTVLRRQAHGREVFVQKILHSFLTNTPRSLQELAAAAATADWTRVAAIVHHIKPGLDAVGVPGVAEAVACLEQDPGAPHPLPRPEAAAHLLAQVGRTLRQLPAEVQK